ncbi:MAG TPA: metal-dependent hydrolase [Myxococcaceae bacterium]|nr:metal-dependent hydrolase [Myxococcaceae bacterium]
MAVQFSRRALLFGTPGAAALAAAAPRGAPAEGPALEGNRLTWLGFSTFLVETAQGEVFLVDPWLSFDGCPLKPSAVKRLDGILVTHGHWQHVGEAVELAKRTGAPIIAVEEVAQALSQAGVPRAPQVNMGGTVRVGGISVSLTQAVHTSGLLDKESGFVGYGGDPVGFVLHLPGGVRVYHAGDTDVFGDMALIRERWAPRIALLPIGDVTTMGPSGAALACGLLGCEAVVPMHYDLPVFTGRPEMLEAELRRRGLGTRVWRARPGVPLS